MAIKIILIISIILLLNGVLVGSIGEVSPSVTRTDSTETTCKGNSCTLSLYSGIRYIYEDKIWKERKEARSFKNSPIKCNVISDGINLAECIDWNETSRTIRLSRTETGSTPLKKYSFKINEADEFEKVYDSKFETQLNFITLIDSYNLVLKANSYDIIEFGEFSTEIILKEADVENVDDAKIYENAPANNYGIDYRIELASYPGSPGWAWRTYMRWNITSIPAGQRIDDATLYLYMYAHPASGGTEIDAAIYHVYNTTWWEGERSIGVPATPNELTWNNQPCGGITFDQANQCNLTAEDVVGTGMTSNVWLNWDITDMFNRDYDAGKTNVSLVIRQIDDDTEQKYQAGFWSKEYNTDPTLRPYVNITYSVPPEADPPVISLWFPPNNTFWRTSYISFTYNVSDAAAIDSCRLYVGDSLPLVTINSTDVDVVKEINNTFNISLADGDWFWKVSCNDTFNNHGDSNINNFTVYTFVPPPSTYCRYFRVNNISSGSNLFSISCDGFVEMLGDLNVVGTTNLSGDTLVEGKFNTTDRTYFVTDIVEIEDGAPRFVFTENDRGLNMKKWYFQVAWDTMRWGTCTDNMGSCVAGLLISRDTQFITLWNYTHGDVEVTKDLRVYEDLDVKGNITAENVHLPSFIFAHTDVDIISLGSGYWHNITFDEEVSTPKRRITHTYNDETNDTFIIVDNGYYNLDYHLSFEDSAPNPTGHITTRVIKNGEEVAGSLREADTTRQNADTLVGHGNILIYLVTDDEIVFQFATDDTTIILASHATFGDHKDTSIVTIERLA